MIGLSNAARGMLQFMYLTESAVGAALAKQSIQTDTAEVHELSRYIQCTMRARFCAVHLQEKANYGQQAYRRPSFGRAVK